MLLPITEENLYSFRISLVTRHFNATDKNIEKLAKSGIIIGFIKYTYFALDFNYIYSVLRNYFICSEKCKTSKLPLIKVKIF